MSARKKVKKRREGKRRWRKVSRSEKQQECSWREKKESKFVEDRVQEREYESSREKK